MVTIVGFSSCIILFFSFIDAVVKNLDKYFHKKYDRKQISKIRDGSKVKNMKL